MVLSYAVGSVVEERMALLQIVRAGWMTALDLGERWGYHRNTLGNWQWRYRYFGLDGLNDQRLPGQREQLEPVVRLAAEILRKQGRRMSVAGLRRELAAHGHAGLPPGAVQWLQGALLQPQALGLPLEEVSDPSEGQEKDPASPIDEGAGAGAPQPPASASPTDGGPAQDSSEQHEARRPGADDGPSGEETGADAPQPVDLTDPTDDGAAEEGPGADALKAVGVAGLADAEGLPLQGETSIAMRHAGMALVLPALQQVLDPLQSPLEAIWGRAEWIYHPWQMIAGFLLYVLAGFRNPEQVKAAPVFDFGPLIGRRRAPACITLRRRLGAMASQEGLVRQLQRQLACLYLQLGWVQPGVWLVDGHFVPYYGKHAWGKGWFPQRRMPHHGHFQEWVHDRQGRPLWMHFSQGFELFADTLPTVADALQELTGERPVLVFDRGGFNAQVFTALNAQGAGWVTWWKGKVRLPPEAFTETGELTAARPGAPARTVHYACTTHQVTGCHAHVAAVVWHQGDPQQQVGLLTNLDRVAPERFRPLELIGMLEGRWAQENSFKAQEQHVDLGWTNGYVHEPASATPVPNPRVRALRQRLALRTQQLRRAMDRPLPRTAQAQSNYRRKLGMLRGQITRTEHELAAIPSQVPYGSLGRKASDQLHPGRGQLVPVLRALTHHLCLQMRAAIATVFPDYREVDKVLRVLLHTPGRYISTDTVDWVILARPQMPRYAAALTALVHSANAAGAHAPGRPNHPLRFALETAPRLSPPMHTAP
ncbi:MAG: hypothetical protein ACP5QO_15020 [Clostridia bacterium]